MKTFVARLVRVLTIGVLIAVAAAVARAVKGKPLPETTGQASWQPLTDEPAAPARSGPVQFVAEPAASETAEAAGAHEEAWIAPIDGVCPATHPIKGNAQSGIFHVPGGQSYDRTVPERCYASAADAEADGFRQAKR
jgi:hypothetical protein